MLSWGWGWGRGKGAELGARHLAMDLDPFVFRFICVSSVLLKPATANANLRGEGKGVIY